MTKCPKCRKDNAKPQKTWKYGHFTVQSFRCNNCGTQYRDYSHKEKHSFTLMLHKGKGYKRV
jgi:transposase-like protein